MYVFVALFFVWLLGKAGFGKWSRWLALLIFPIPFMILIWALRKPVEKEPDQDPEELQAQALASYNSGNLVEAESIFHLLAEELPGTPIGDEAMAMVDLIARQKSGQPPPLPLRGRKEKW
jgi:hypothetical protein